MNTPLNIWTLAALTLVSAALVFVSGWDMTATLPGQITTGLMVLLCVAYVGVSTTHHKWRLPKRVYHIHFLLTIAPLMILIWSLSLWINLPAWWEVPTLIIVAFLALVVMGMCHDHQHDADALLIILATSFVLMLPYLMIAGYHMHHGTQPISHLLHFTQMLAVAGLTIFVANFFLFYYTNQNSSLFVLLDPLFGLLPVGLVGLLTSTPQDWTHILGVGLSASALVVLSSKKITAPIYANSLKILKEEDVTTLKDDIAHSFWSHCQEHGLAQPDTLKLIWCEHPKLPIQGLMLRAFLKGHPVLPAHESVCDSITEKFPSKLVQAHWYKEIELSTGPQTAHQKMQWHQKERKY